MITKEVLDNTNFPLEVKLEPRDDIMSLTMYALTRGLVIREYKNKIIIDKVRPEL